MQRLVTFGCSLTQGQCLESSSRTDNSYSKLAWPFLLAKKLNLKCHNAGINGSSAKKIWHTIANFEFRDDDIVVVLWTHQDRWCLFTDDGTVDFFPSMVDERKLTKQFYTDFYNEIDIMEMYSLFVDHSTKIIRDKGLKIYNLKASTWEYGLKYTDLPYLKTKMEKIRKQYPRALDGSHPGIEAHEEFASQVYKEIIELENT